KGRSSYDRGDYVRAAAEARGRLKDDPGDREALRLLARAEARRGNEGLSGAIFDRLGPEAWQAEDAYLVAARLERVGEPDRARLLLRESTGREGGQDHPASLAALARLDAGMDDYEE